MASKNELAKFDRERRLLKVFAAEYNRRYGADYALELAEVVDSDWDGVLRSQSGDFSDLRVQLKEVKEHDPELSFGERGARIVAFDTNPFGRANLEKRLCDAAAKYASTAPSLVLALEVMVNESWIRDWWVEKGASLNLPFLGVYCFGVASYQGDNAFVFPLKEVPRP